MPHLVALAESEPSIRVVGLNVRDEPASARAFAAEFGVDFPSIVDADGSLLRSVPGVPPAALPSTLVLDEQGRIAARIIGPASAEQLRQSVDAASN
ncbi:MAG: TlpA family protein disulfide reductase [Actinomycetales bacterium]